MTERVFVDTSIKVCMGCLSTNRNLQLISSTKVLEHLHKIIEPLVMPKPVLMCWECLSILSKMLKFCDKIKTSLLHLSSVQDEQHKYQLTSLNSSPIELINNFEECQGFLVASRPVCSVVDIPVKVEVISTHQFNLKEEQSLALSEDGFSDSDNEPLIVKSMNKTVDIKSSEVKDIHLKMKQRNTSNENVTKSKIKREKMSGIVSNSRVKKKLQEINIEGQVEMLYLTWDEVESERERLTSRPSFAAARFSCDKCAVTFSHTDKYTRHMAKHAPNSDAVICEYCTVHCKDNRALAAHLRRHRVRWRCKQCSRMFSRAGVAADHCRAHHSAHHKHTCRQCGLVASSFGALRKHNRQDHSEPQKCEICDRIYPDKVALKAHMFIHVGKKEHACPECGKRFLFRNTMVNHLATHDNTRPYYCHQCDMNFKTPACYKQHMSYSLKHITPDKMKHVCADCGKRFVQKSRLTEHRTAVHLKLTPVNCQYDGCQFVCSTKTVLRSHKRLVHRKGSVSRNHVCHVCGQAYTSKKCLEGHLKRHESTHTQTDNIVEVDNTRTKTSTEEWRQERKETVKVVPL